VRCRSGKNALLDLLARSLRPSNEMELAKRLHEWILSVNLLPRWAKS
jgi:hypothetical protein